MKDFPLITSNQNNGKSTFTFEIEDINSKALKVEFVNSSYLSYY